MTVIAGNAAAIGIGLEQLASDVRFCVGYRAMKSRETKLRLRQFEVEEKRQKVTDLEVMIHDFNLMAGDLDRQISAEEERTSVKDSTHYAYSTFAKAAGQRRDNLVASVDDLKIRLERAEASLDEALSALKKAEQNDTLSTERRQSERGRSFAGGTIHRMPHRA